MTGASPTLGALAAALAAAQAEMSHASKDGKNPHFRSTYATLSSVLDATRPVLARHKIAILQLATSEGKTARVETRLIHESGEWISATSTAEARDGSPQSIGSAQTYLRRYGLQAIAGIAAEDDDGEAAQPARPATRDRDRGASEHAAFVTAVQALGIEYEALTAYLVDIGLPLPPLLSADRRAKMLAALEPGQAFRAKLDAFIGGSKP